MISHAEWCYFNSVFGVSIQNSDYLRQFMIQIVGQTIIYTRQRCVKGELWFAEQEVVVGLPSAYCNLLLVKSDPAVLCVGVKSSGLPLKQLLKESWITSGGQQTVAEE